MYSIWTSSKTLLYPAVGDRWTSSASAKNPVTGIPQARQDVTVRIQLAVDGCREDRHIRVGFLQGSDTFRAG
jgi:hypothetical protein